MCQSCAREDRGLASWHLGQGGAYGPTLRAGEATEGPKECPGCGQVQLVKNGLEVMVGVWGQDGVGRRPGDSA